jgi:hypothetical protein
MRAAPLPDARLVVLVGRAPEAEAPALPVPPLPSPRGQAARPAVLREQRPQGALAAPGATKASP